MMMLTTERMRYSGVERTRTNERIRRRCNSRPIRDEVVCSSAPLRTLRSFLVSSCRACVAFDCVRRRSSTASHRDRSFRVNRNANEREGMHEMRHIRTNEVGCSRDCHCNDRRRTDLDRCAALALVLQHAATDCHCRVHRSSVVLFNSSFQLSSSVIAFLLPHAGLFSLPRRNVLRHVRVELLSLRILWTT